MPGICAKDFMLHNDSEPTMERITATVVAKVKQTLSRKF